MELVCKAAAISVASVLFALVIKKTNPELSLLLGLVTALICVFLGAELLSGIRMKLETWQSGSLVSWNYFVPLGKCVVISFVTQIGTGLCKDAGHSAAATALELCGNLASVWCLLPLMEGLLGILEGLL